MGRFHGEKIHFVTGRLAETALRRTLASAAPATGVTATIQVMPISVAALMTPSWIAKHLQIPPESDRIIVPGYCGADLSPLTQESSIPVEVGPKDLRELPEFLGEPPAVCQLDDYDIEIIAEINHAPQLPVNEILDQAQALSDQGANIIDVGCNPGSIWKEVHAAVRALVDRGHRVSIDSLEPREIEPAVRAGAQLVLSVNSTNRNAAMDWGCEVVVIPDDPSSWRELDETIEFLASRNVPMRIDPVLEPIGLGFGASLYRYFQARKMWPDSEMMMGIGNLSELSDVDSAGLNLVLIALCQDLEIRSVLTTQVINWARSAVKECDVARRLTSFACQNKVPPKNLSSQLICLRDPRLTPTSLEDIAELASLIRDDNYRIFAEDGEIHLLGGQRHLHGRDAFELFEQLLHSNPKNADASHAFYLGYEMCKATIAMQLGKQYRQDEALQWGHLTVDESQRHRLGKKKTKKFDAENASRDAND